MPAHAFGRDEPGPTGLVESGEGFDMGAFTFKLPDLGEGTVESEIVQWRVQPGD
ncbi:MAG: hypothetical protein HYR49_05360, partial [Gammaproteobacteria bacterium]|nr:hypothetical protein [Gammaproteobacteria bacterium]